LPLLIDLLTEIDYDTILVIVDRLTKYSHLIPFKETYNTEKIGQILLDKLIRYYRILIVVISNRDKLFTLVY